MLTLRHIVYSLKQKQQHGVDFSLKSELLITSIIETTTLEKGAEPPKMSLGDVITELYFVSNIVFNNADG